MIERSETRDAVRTPLAFAHIIVEWLDNCRTSFEEQAAALDIAKRLLHIPRRPLIKITEVLSLSSDAPILNQSSRDTDHRAETQDVDACQSPGN
jgi:hypothetical protein